MPGVREVIEGEGGIEEGGLRPLLRPLMSPLLMAHP